MTSYNVYSTETGDLLSGEPTGRLVKASLAAGDTGNVAAFEDENSQWFYVREDEIEARRAQGHDVITVYVQEA